MSETADNAVLFRRVLRPHRSAGGMMLFRVLLLVAMALTALSMTFIALGAWPVSGFLGLELVLLGGAFWLNERRLRTHETIDLTNSVLIVERIDVGSGKRLDDLVLQVSDSVKVVPGTAHRPFNPDTAPCRFVLIQGVGKYDFLPFRQDSAGI